MKQKSDGDNGSRVDKIEINGRIHEIEIGPKPDKVIEREESLDGLLVYLLEQARKSPYLYWVTTYDNHGRSFSGYIDEESSIWRLYLVGAGEGGLLPKLVSIDPEDITTWTLDSKHYAADGNSRLRALILLAAETEWSF